MIKLNWLESLLIILNVVLFMKENIVRKWYIRDEKWNFIWCRSLLNVINGDIFKFYLSNF